MNNASSLSNLGGRESGEPHFIVNVHRSVGTQGPNTCNWYLEHSLVGLSHKPVGSDAHSGMAEQNRTVEHPTGVQRVAKLIGMRKTHRFGVRVLWVKTAQSTSTFSVEAWICICENKAYYFSHLLIVAKIGASRHILTDKLSTSLVFFKLISNC